MSKSRGGPEIKTRFSITNVKRHEIKFFDSNCEIAEAAARANGNNHSSFDDAESGGSVSDYAPSNVMYDLRHKSLAHRGTGIQT